MSQTTAEKILANRVKAPAGVNVEDLDPDNNTFEVLSGEVIQGDTEESDEPLESETEEQEAEESEEDSFPDKVKEVLKKERKITREAEARAIAAEKALKELQDGEKNDNEGSSKAADSRYKDLYLASAAKTALVQAGLTKGTERFLKMVDMSVLDVDDEGNVTGLEDQIAGLTTEFEDLVVKEVKRVPVTKVDGGGRRETPPAPKTSAEILAEKLKRN